MDISHIVTTYNKAEYLPSVAAALLNQAGDWEREIIFVDDASTDQTPAVLQELAQREPRIKLILNQDNRGPAWRFNQGVEAARGTWLHLLDGDDIAPTNVCTTLLQLARREHADVVYGRWRKTGQPPAALLGKTMESNPSYRVSDTPLDFVLNERCVRMTLMCRRDIYQRAGGADPRLFIQDESLPLRLAHVAQRWMMVEAPVVLVPQEHRGLSQDKRQQHHDRFFAYYNILHDFADLTPEQRRSLARRAISSAWKYTRRQPGLALTKPLFWYYLRSRLPGVVPNPLVLEAMAEMFRALPGVRRVAS